MNIYLVSTDNGVRPWHAEDEQHARDQHLDGFADEPGEEIRHIAVPLCDHCERKPSTEVLGDSYGEFTYCHSCAEGIRQQADDSARRLAKEGHFHD